VLLYLRGDAQDRALNRLLHVEHGD
jgi:hypothetical protein